MKKLLILLSVLIYLAISGSVSAISLIGSGISGAVDNCGSTGVLDENFDKVGYCNSEFGTNESVGASNTLDEDDTTDPQSNTYDLKYVLGNSGNDCWTYSTFTEQTGISYYKIKVKITGAFGASYVYLIILSPCTDSTYTNEAFSIRIGQANDTTPRILLYNSGAANQQLFTGALNTWYTIIVKYPSDGTGPTEWKVNGAAQTNVVDTSDLSVDNLLIGAPNAIQGTTTHANGILIEDIIVSPNAGDVGWS